MKKIAASLTAFLVFNLFAGFVTKPSYAVTCSPATSTHTVRGSGTVGVGTFSISAKETPEKEYGKVQFVHTGGHKVDGTITCLTVNGNRADFKGTAKIWNGTSWDPNWTIEGYAIDNGTSGDQFSLAECIGSVPQICITYISTSVTSGDVQVH